MKTVLILQEKRFPLSKESVDVSVEAFSDYDILFMWNEMKSVLVSVTVCVL